MDGWTCINVFTKAVADVVQIFSGGLLLSNFGVFSIAKHASVLKIIPLWVTFDT